ncbi:hypothetical protein DS6A_66 [Mycobacterium phage DS6A]|uniref:Uncharacterized protein n=1 Tax=Mycobacterium phage DS6A TaxID=45764 RepID=G8I4H6_9CAUD|nr:hypothetical protein DS6A_66 [Mycobacterium phage DS6A]AER47620.1 hypothetical protein DS6A_66 [Mycobacterium phage DS6A]
MKFIDSTDAAPRLELTRRNLETLLAKLDDPLSGRTLIAPGGELWVTAVESRAGRPLPRQAHIDREDLTLLLSALDEGDPCWAQLTVPFRHGALEVAAVENDAHYSDRPPGPIYMPSTGVTL